MSIVLHYLRIFLLLGIGLLATPAHALNIFMNFPGIVGTSLDAAHTGEIVLLNWAWGVVNSGNLNLVDGGGATIEFQNFRITKEVDRASPPLALRVATGEVEDMDVVISDVVTFAGSSQDVRTATLKNVRVTSLSAVITDSGQMIETLELVADEVLFKFVTFSNTGQITSTCFRVDFLDAENSSETDCPS